MKKRILSVFLCLMMCLSLLPEPALAQVAEAGKDAWNALQETKAGYNLSGNASGNLTATASWALDVASGVLSITGTGDIPGSNADELPWKDRLAQIKSVTIAGGITSVGSGLFSGCANLTAVTLPKTVTVVGANAFAECAALTTVQYDGSESDWLSMTLGGGNLTLLRAYFSASHAIAASGEADGYGNSLIWVLDQDGNLLIGCCDGIADFPANNEGMGEPVIRAPWYGMSVKTVTIGNGVQRIGVKAFADCTQLTSVKLGSGLQSVDKSAFSGCTALNAIAVPTLALWDALSLGSAMPNAYQLSIGGKLLTALTISADITAVKENAFAGCSSLQSLTIPATVTSIAANAFAGCANLDTISGGSGLVDVHETAFENSKIAASQSDFVLAGSILLKAQGSAAAVTIPSGVTVIAANAFYQRSNLQSITIPDSVTAISHRAFALCDVKAVTVGSGVTTMGADLFYNDLLMSPLEKITFTGDAPAIDAQAFRNVSADACYRNGNSSWTAALQQNYGGTLTWSAYEPPHSFTYAVSANQLTATCGNDACLLTGGKVTLTLSAAGGSYNGSAYTAAYASGEAAAWKAATGSDAPTITYYKKSAPATALNGAPVHAGTYLAKAAVNGKTAVVEFTITKIAPGVTKSFSAEVASAGVSSKTLSLQLPAGATAQITNRSGIVSAATVQNGTLVYSTEQSSGGSGSVTIHVSGMEDYTDYDITVSITAQKEKIGFAQKIANFFKSIGDFFKRLFGG